MIDRHKGKGLKGLGERYRGTEAQRHKDTEAQRLKKRVQGFEGKGTEAQDKRLHRFASKRVVCICYDTELFCF